MRKWIIFIGLKVIEAAVLLGIPYLFYVVGDHFCHREVPWFVDILYGFVACSITLFLVYMAFLIIFVIIPYAINKNIEWAKKIDQKFFGRK